MHIVNDVERVDIELRHPRTVFFERFDHFVVIENAFLEGLALGTDLNAADLVPAAVERHQEHFRQVATRAEILHLLTHAHCRNAAGDGVIVVVYRTHDVVVFVLNGIRVDRDLGAELLVSFGEIFAPENGDVRFRRRAEVIERVEDAVGVFRHHVSAV